MSVLVDTWQLRTPGRGVSIPSFREGSGHCIGGLGPRGGPDLLERSGTPGCSGCAPAHPGTRGAPRPVPAGGRVRDCCWVNRAPDRRGPAVWTQSRVTTRLLPRHSKRGYPNPGVPTVAPGPTSGEVRTRGWGHYRDVLLRNLIVLVCSWRERASWTPGASTPVARFRY